MPKLCNSRLIGSRCKSHDSFAIFQQSRDQDQAVKSNRKIAMRSINSGIILLAIYLYVRLVTSNMVPFLPAVKIKKSSCGSEFDITLFWPFRLLNSILNIITLLHTGHWVLFPKQVLCLTETVEEKFFGGEEELLYLVSPQGISECKLKVESGLVLLSAEEIL